MVGEKIINIILPEFSTVDCLIQHILHRYPHLCNNTASLAIAVNQEYQDHDYVLKGGDEVALIPPVSGGSQFKM